LFSHIVWYHQCFLILCPIWWIFRFAIKYIWNLFCLKRKKKTLSHIYPAWRRCRWRVWWRWQRRRCSRRCCPSGRTSTCPRSWIHRPGVDVIKLLSVVTDWLTGRISYRICSWQAFSGWIHVFLSKGICLNDICVAKCLMNPWHWGDPGEAS